MSLNITPSRKQLESEKIVDLALHRMRTDAVVKKTPRGATVQVAQTIRNCRDCWHADSGRHPRLCSPGSGVFRH